MDPRPAHVFSREDVVIPRVCLTYLGIHEGHHSDLVLAWSPVDFNNNRFMSIVRALEYLVGSERVGDFRVAVDPVTNDGFIRCSHAEVAEYLRGHCVLVGHEEVYFFIIRNVLMPPFDEDVNQHLEVHAGRCM